MGLLSYAENSILKLGEIMNLDAYDLYIRQIEERKAAREASLESW